MITQELSSNCVSKAILEATIDALHSLTLSSGGWQLVAALQQRSSYACSLFRILTTALLKNISPHIEGTAVVELLKGDDKSAIR